MKTTVDITRVSGGIMEGNLYASAILIDGELMNQIEDERINVGKQPAKLRIDTADNNRLVKGLARSGLIPGPVEVSLKTTVRGGESSLCIIGFTPRKI